MLTNSDYLAIAGAAAALQRSTAAQPRFVIRGDLDFFGGIEIWVTGTPNGIRNWDEIVAAYSPISRHIMLKGLLMGPVDASPECRAHLIACIAHEVRHRLQDEDPNRAGEIAEATRLSREYEAAPTPEHYAAYLHHPIEREAFGTMIAAAAIALNVPKPALRDTALWRRCVERMEGCAQVERVLADLLVETEAAFDVMTI